MNVFALDSANNPAGAQRTVDLSVMKQGQSASWKVALREHQAVAGCGVATVVLAPTFRLTPKSGSTQRERSRTVRRACPEGLGPHVGPRVRRGCHSVRDRADNQPCDEWGSVRREVQVSGARTTGERERLEKMPAGSIPS